MMRGLFTALAFGFAGLSAAAVQGQTSPPVPAPATPPPPDAGTPAAPAPGSPRFTLGQKSETITPGTLGDGLAEGGKIDVATPDPDTLKVTITGASAAHCRVGLHSAGVQRFQLVQEFEVASDDPAAGGVVLTLESALNGYVRARHKGGACMRLADATVAPAGGGTGFMSVAYPPLCAQGASAQLYKREIKANEVPSLPPGRYVLTANFQIEANAEGLINGHGVANFGPDALPDPWKQSTDPFKDEDAKDYGFSITLKVAAPGAAGQTVAARTRREARPAAR